MIPQPPKRYILTGTFRAAQQEARDHHLYRPPTSHDRIYEWFTWVGPDHWRLEGVNILPGDAVLFGYGCTADMIDRFIDQAWSRGTKLSDLRIIHK